jgi:hypothetical protein
MLNWSWILNFEHLSKATIVSMVTGLSKPLDHNEPFELESDNETAEVENDLQLSMQEKLFSKSKANVELILSAVTKI